MKKIFFSLVAFTTFSFTSFANDISEVKKKNEFEKSVLPINQVSSIGLINGNTCYDRYVGVYVYLLNMGFTREQSAHWALIVYSDCIKSTYLDPVKMG